MFVLMAVAKIVRNIDVLNPNSSPPQKCFFIGTISHFTFHIFSAKVILTHSNLFYIIFQILLELFCLNAVTLTDD